MKKTIKRSLVLLTIITALLVCTFAFTASAEGIECIKNADGTVTHHAAFIEEIRFDPTCTQKGFIRTMCTNCNQIIIDKDYTQNETGHNYTVSYEKDADGYKRVLTCQNELCVRGATEEENIVNSYVYDDAKYYSVKFISKYDSPADAATDHKTYFNEEYYVASDRSTWLAEKYLENEYIASTKINDNGSNVSPAYEFISREGEIQLFVKEGEKAPDFAGNKYPIRLKDVNIGKYTFRDWEADGVSYKDTAITENTVFEAAFNADENVTVTVTFYDGDRTVLTTGVSVPYGTTVSYDTYGLKAPSKESDERNYYTFDGWTLGSSNHVYSDEITLYSSTSAFAHFAATANKYTVRFINNSGLPFYDDNANELGVSENVVYGGSANGIQEISQSALELPRDKKFIYSFTGNWTLKKLNGKDVMGGYSMNPASISLPAKLTVLGDDGVYSEVKIKDGDVLTLAPVYTSQYVRYYIPINIITVRFEEEDLFEDNSMIRSDILDDFVIQVTDSNGQYVGGGMTDENGQFILSTTYADTLYITAKTVSNSKYFGEHTLELRYCTTPEQIEEYEKNGIAIAPSVTQEWLDGISRPCGCICHSFLSPIIIRIYNIVYRIFNYKFVCCDDLFVTHGSILAYTR